MGIDVTSWQGAQIGSRDWTRVYSIAIKGEYRDTMYHEVGDTVPS